MGNLLLLIELAGPLHEAVFMSLGLRNLTDYEFDQLYMHLYIGRISTYICVCLYMYERYTLFYIMHHYYKHMLLLFTIAIVNGNRPDMPGTVNGKGFNISKNHVYICSTLFTIATVNGNQLGTVDGESINLSKNHVYVALLLP